MVIRNRGIDQIPVEHRCIFVRIDVQASFHIPALALPVLAPGDLESHFLGGCLSFYRAIGHEGLLPVVIYSGLVLARVSRRVC
jgi:hypothetical protein